MFLTYQSLNKLCIQTYLNSICQCILAGNMMRILLSDRADDVEFSEFVVVRI